MVAPSPSTRRPPPRPQPRPYPPSARRRPPRPPYGRPSRHHGRRRLVLILVLTTVAAVGYLYVTRGGGATTAGVVGSEQRVVKAVDTMTAAASKVQRFGELHTFDLTTLAQITTLGAERDRLQNIAAGASGAQQQIATQAVTDVKLAIDAAIRYRRAIAFTYRLADADTARKDLSDAVASLTRQAQAWQHT